MLSLGLIGFETPLVLAALALLPVIWWLLRITPPKPHTVRFPPVRFLLDLKDKLTTPDKSPWWLTALRIFLSAVLIVALAGPTLNPTAPLALGQGAILVVVDDGWASARSWPARLSALNTISSQAAQARRPVILATTAPAKTGRDLEPQSAAQFRDTLKSIQPQPFFPDRKSLSALLDARKPSLEIAKVFWLSDGLDYGAAAAFTATLNSFAQGNLTLMAPAANQTGLLVGEPVLKDGQLTLRINRAEKTGEARSSVIRAVATNGRVLADMPFAFQPDANQATAQLKLPLELRNQVARLEVVDEKSAGGVFLLDDRWRQKAIGLATSNVRAEAQPLLSAMHYVNRALEPKAALKVASPAENNSGLQNLIKQGLSALILADIGKLQPKDENTVAAWVESGGILVRFAGPRLAGGNDALVPVKLRRGDRALGGALSWSKAQLLAPFDDASPFFGLKVPADVTVSRQVLAEPSALAGVKIWARLQDGTPLVTAVPKGSGLVVLFHIPSNPGWSNLPLSGLFVEMLHKLVDLAPVTISNANRTESVSGQTRQSLIARKTLDGFGQLANPAAHVKPVTQDIIARSAISPDNPPGLYGPQNAARALNLGGQDIKMTNLAVTLTQQPLQFYGPGRILDLKPILLISALALFLLDALIVFFLSGGLRSIALPRGTALILLCVLIAALQSPTAIAQTQSPGATPPELQNRQSAPPAQPGSKRPADELFALEATQKTRLAYVITGNSEIDAVSRAGMRGLSTALTRRTAFEPGQPIGINLERDDITFFPLIYWPIVSTGTLPSPLAMAKIDTFMKRGGTVLFDTLDHQQSLPDATGAVNSPNTQRLRQLLAKLDIPALEVVPANHVITKAFYLQQDFPGRWAGGRLWVEATAKRDANTTTTQQSNDGVSSIMIGANNYAAAWAEDIDGRPMYPVVPGGDRQREMAFRTGVNIVMYVLTGNYKADQVHIPSLLERLGQ